MSMCDLFFIARSKKGNNTCKYSFNISFAPASPIRYLITQQLRHPL